jgi:uncharacterized membrane protein SpoIIM required for sporulation
VGELMISYDGVSAELYRLRKKAPPTDPLRMRIEDMVSTFSQDLLDSQARSSEARVDSENSWLMRYRQIWRDESGLFLLSALLFVAGSILGWQIVTEHPDYASSILPQNLIGSILEHHRWFEDIQTSPVIEGLQIAFNNIKVTLTCFIFGALLGLGGFWILFYNGLLLGAVLAFCNSQGFDDELWNFVIGHGMLELTIIISGAFASFLFGRVFYMRPYSEFGARMRIAGRDASTVIAGVLPWLLLAAFIEVGVSPWPQFSSQSRFIIGAGAALSFWAWTFWPKSFRFKRTPNAS